MVAGCSRQSEGNRGNVNQAFSVLAAPERRTIVGFFRKTDYATVSVRGLADVCNLEGAENGGGTTTDYLVTTLRHQHLPKLEDAGVIEYDRESQRVSYRGDALVEDLLESAPDTNL